MTVNPRPGQSVHMLSRWDVLRVRFGIEGRNAAELALHTTDDLRRLYGEQKGGLIRLPDGIVSRAELVAEIRWRVWWSSLAARVTLWAAIIAAVGAILGAWFAYLALPQGSH